MKARVGANGLSPFCQSVIGSVLAYNPSEPDKTLPLKVQVEFVPAEKRKSLVGGTKLEMRGMVALPQLQGIVLRWGFTGVVWPFGRPLKWPLRWPT